VFCEAFGLAALAADATLTTQRQRVEARDRTLPIVAAAFRGFTRAELMARCEALGLPFAPIARPAELFDDPHLNGSGGLVAVTLPDGRETKLPALPLSLDGERLGRRRDLPQTGEHGTEIARELGYSEAEIAVMQGAGTLV
jgi:crotonobetainyl-CoA:carnitine CoA-transferase CaiB-like acyl-CoA transferase